MYHSIFYYYTLKSILLLQLSVPTLYVMVTDVCLTAQPRTTTYQMLTAKQTDHLERLFEQNENVDATTKCEVAVTLGLAEEKVCMCERTHSFSCFLHRSLPHSIIAPTSLPPSPLPTSPSPPINKEEWSWLVHHTCSGIACGWKWPSFTVHANDGRKLWYFSGFGGAAFTASRQLAIEPGLKLAVTLHHLYINIVTVCRMSCTLTK